MLCIVYFFVCMLSCFQPSVTLWTIAYLAPLSMGFPRQEYWSGLPLPPLGDLPNPGINPASLVSPVLADSFFTTAPPGKPYCPHVLDASPQESYIYFLFLSLLIYYL